MAFKRSAVRSRLSPPTQRLASKRKRGFLLWREPPLRYAFWQDVFHALISRAVPFAPDFFAACCRHGVTRVVYNSIPLPFSMIL